MPLGLKDNLFALSKSSVATESVGKKIQADINPIYQLFSSTDQSDFLST